MYARKIITIYLTKPKIHLYQATQNYMKIHGYTGTIQFAFIFYSFFTYLENEGRGWMMIVVCEERELIKKIKKIDI